MVDRRRCGIEVTEGVGVDADEEEAVLALVISGPLASTEQPLQTLISTGWQILSNIQIRF
jgi:hypothetical protein